MPQSPFLLSLQLHYYSQYYMARLMELWSLERADKFSALLVELARYCLLGEPTDCVNEFIQSSDSARICWAQMWHCQLTQYRCTELAPTAASWLESDSHKLSKDLLSLGPPTQQGFAELLLHKLSKDMLSLHSANSARICWAAAPQPQQGFTTPPLHQLS